MEGEKLAFALLVAFSLAFVAIIAIGPLPKQPVAVFAYGANLGAGAMESRAGGYINATPATLQGHSLAFASQDARPTEFGVATLLPEQGKSVQGALYYLTQEQLAALDKQSGAPGFYERREVEALVEGNLVKAQAHFLSGNAHFAVPSRSYYLSVVGGMREWGYGTGPADSAFATAIAGD